MVNDASRCIENEKWIRMNRILMLASTTTSTESEMWIGAYASTWSDAVIDAVIDRLTLMILKSMLP
jgi:hypothetical protein